MAKVRLPKRLVLILLTLAMTVSLFAACSGSGTTVTDAPAATATATPAATTAPASTDAPTATEEPALTMPIPVELPHAGDSLAADANGVAKFAVEDVGYGIFASENYDYELPLSTNSDVELSMYYWLFDPMLQTTDSMRDMPYQTYIRDKTGVNLNYITLAFDAVQPAFQIALAADDLPDIVINPTSYYTAGTQTQLVDENYLVNLYDYRAYMPNYLYQIPRFEYDMDMVAQYFVTPEIMVAMWGYYENPTPDLANMFRGDILENIGIDIKTINTYDKVYDALVRLQTEGGIANPMQLYGPMIEGVPGAFFAGMNTSIYIGAGVPASRIDNGKVVYTLTEEPDRKAAELLNKWSVEGLIDPNWQESGTASTSRGPALLNSQNVFSQIAPGVTADMIVESGIPGYYWASCPNIAETENYEFRYSRGMKPLKLDFASWGINAKCKNVPLAISYGDYFYSEEGKFDLSWGTEGVSYYYDEQGAVSWTDFMLDRVTIKMTMFAGSHFIEVGLVDRARAYAYPEGRKLREMIMAYVIPDYPFKGGNDWPSTAAKPTDEKLREVAALQGDIGTYISENYTQFVTGSKPLSEWDAYVTAVYNIGLGRVQDIYQGVYDSFIEKYPDYKQPGV
ncbi:MAG: hypothetical protein LBN43_03350 [Oscillospiraceae bacterium]|jgi:putative aldouronate transport system substrate-binding protein|nr:hypothetical protein [Oscillospiraceae bacterium]